VPVLFPKLTVFEVELPRIETNNIEVNLTDHMLTMKGEKEKRKKDITIGALIGVFHENHFG